jgi:hypothetical protein
MTWVHIQSTLQSTFGRVDEHGDVVEMRQASVVVKALTPEAAAHAVAEIQEARGRLSLAPAQTGEAHAPCD